MRAAQLSRTLVFSSAAALSRHSLRRPLALRSTMATFFPETAAPTDAEASIGPNLKSVVDRVAAASTATPRAAASDL